MPKKKDDDLISLSTASHILEKSADTVRRWGEKGLLERVPIDDGKLVFYKRGDVERLAAERRKGPQKSRGSEG